MADTVAPLTNPPTKSPRVPPAPKDNFARKLQRIITSAVLLIIAFMAVHVFLDAMMAGIAHMLGYRVTVNYNYLRFEPRDYHFWNKPRIFMAFAFPPLFCLFLALMLLNFLRVNSNWIKSARLFIFWVMICLANVCLAHLFFSVLGITEHDEGYEMMPFYQTFAVMGSWMFLTAAVMGAFSVMAVIASVVFGVITRDEILRFSPSGRATQKPIGKHLIVIQLYFIPVAIGFFPLVGLSNKTTIMPMMFIYINLLIIGIGMFIRNAGDNKSMRPDKYDVLNHVPVIEMIIAVIIWVGIFFFYKQ